MATVGERIAEARAESGITQEQLASAVGLARSALAKIETGARRVSAVELVAIGRELQRRVEWFVEPGPPAITSYRDEKTEPGTQAIDVELDRIVRDVEFVISHTSGLVTNQPEPVTPPQSAEDADAMATEARTMLGLDPATPAHDLPTLVATIGLLPFSLHLDAGADVGTVLLATGGVTVINGDQRVGRRRLALAHELGHYLCADPYTTDCGSQPTPTPTSWNRGWTASRAPSFSPRQTCEIAGTPGTPASPKDSGRLRSAPGATTAST